MDCTNFTAFIKESDKKHKKVSQRKLTCFHHPLPLLVGVLYF